MFIVTNRISVAPEGAAAFEAHFAQSMRDTLGGVPGLRRATLLRPEKPGLPFISTMEFERPEDFRAWLQSDSFRASHSDRSAPGMDAQNSVETHTLVLEV